MRVILLFPKPLKVNLHALISNIISMEILLTIKASPGLVDERSNIEENPIWALCENQRPTRLSSGHCQLRISNTPSYTHVWPRQKSKNCRHYSEYRFLDKKWPPDAACRSMIFTHDCDEGHSSMLILSLISSNSLGMYMYYAMHSSDIPSMQSAIHRCHEVLC